MRGTNDYRMRRMGTKNLNNNGRMKVMDWTKLSVKYGLVEYNKLPGDEYKAWSQIMLLTARDECLPSEAEILKFVKPKVLKSLEKMLLESNSDYWGNQKPGKTLKEILEKVLEDVRKLQKKKKDDRERLVKKRDVK